MRGKRPGAADDFAVIADSTGGRQRADLDRITRRMIPGNPGATTRGPAALPWVMAGPVAGDRIGVAIIDWPEEPVHDAFGRPAVEMRYVDCAFAHLADAGVGYDQLAGVVSGLRLPPAGPLAPALGPPDLAATARLIDEDFSWYAATAASLLDGALVLRDAPDVPVVRRVHLLEALSSLLPYGVRGELSLSTYLSPLTATNTRLGFGAGAVRGVRSVPWRGPGGGPRLSAAARRYLGLLREIRDAAGADTRALLATLRADERRLPLADGRAVVAHAEALRQQMTTLAQLRAGQARPSAVERVLRWSSLKLFQASEWKLLLDSYVRHTPVTELDVNLLRRQRPSQVIPLLAAHAVDAVDLDAARAYLGTGRRLGVLDEVVGDMVAKAVTRPDAAAAARRAVTVLLEVAGGRDELRAAVAEEEQACRGLAAALILGPDPRLDLAAAFVRWLCSGPGRPASWLAGYAAALSGTAVEWTGPWHPSARDAAAIVVAAAENGNLDLVAAPVWASLTGDLDQAWRDRLGGVLRDLPPRYVDRLPGDVRDAFLGKDQKRR
ncbi:hypothetical protein GCM10009681_22190 [Luedemannella helvata]|uniref:Uncharacterized protein n=1 Tax=Luedemannella helvata TaxID=349315 RepID=A0ABN2K8L7_9ACTN